MKKTCSRRGKLGKQCLDALDSLMKVLQQEGYHTGWTVTIRKEGWIITIDGSGGTIRANDGEHFLIFNQQPDALLLAAQHKTDQEMEYLEFLEDLTTSEPLTPPWLTEALESIVALTGN